MTHTQNKPNNIHDIRVACINCGARHRYGDHKQHTCPTPDNVECQTCHGRCRYDIHDEDGLRGWQYCTDCGGAGTTPENVECQTCLDTGCILLDELEDDHSFYKSEPCPDCTPWCPTCKGTGVHKFEDCPDCGGTGRSTPENVECPECDALVEEAIQWRDWQSLDIGVYCDKHTPENVDFPGTK